MAGKGKTLLKKIFASKVAGSASLDTLGAESANYVESVFQDHERFIPAVNYVSSSNFARYASAEQYYKDSFTYISNEFPYDGSKNEKIQWHLSGTYFDRHVFDNVYPRTNGYINFGLNYGTPSGGGGNLSDTSVLEFIQFVGVNTTIPMNVTPNQTLPLNFDNLQMYNTSSQGTSNLEVDGNVGFGAEFWLKKNGWPAAESLHQVVLDVWNSSSVDPGLFRILAITGSGQFRARIVSGAVNNNITLTVPGYVYPGTVIATNKWEHWAFTFVNSGSNLVAKLYHDGKLIDSDDSGDSIDKITGSMIGNIGATTYYGNAPTTPGDYGEGWGKLSGSLDEFRFWKRHRSAKQIGLHWFTQIDGGTNTDITNAEIAETKYSYSNPVDLGFYYKFNEGIMDSGSVNSDDKTVLDYSGRVINGTWHGYGVGSRRTGSAMVLSDASTSEYKDPILYSNNPRVTASLGGVLDEAILHDATNNAAIFNTLPGWIRDDDVINDRLVLYKLTQIIGSYFDTLQLQIDAVPRLKDINYASSSAKPFPFTSRLIDGMGFNAGDLFNDASVLEDCVNRDDVRDFAIKLTEVKNRIYQNIYNNLTTIFKSKGTEKSFRNLIRCYGVNDELIKLNLYANNITHQIRDNYETRDNFRSAVVKKRYANFNNAQTISSVVVQSGSLTGSGPAGYISASYQTAYLGNTYEAEALFPKKVDLSADTYYATSFTASSLFGCHTVDNAAPHYYGWGHGAVTDTANFQIKAIRPDLNKPAVYFQLTSSDPYPIPTLTSSLFNNTYENTKWNLSVRVKPSKYPYAGATGSLSGSYVTTYDLIFTGYNNILDTTVNQFKVTGTLTQFAGEAFMTGSKRFFLGAHRQNFTGSRLHASNVKISSMRCWFDYLDDKTLQAHARDASNFGTANPLKPAYLTSYVSGATAAGRVFGQEVVEVPQMETLALNWEFNTLTSSNASGEFEVADLSSGSSTMAERYGWFGPYAKRQHTGRGYLFPASDSSSISREFVYSARQTAPEVINSSNMVEVVSEDSDSLFRRDDRPITFFLAAEKSLYALVTDEILKIFGTINDFNNLIGEPVNRYRFQYKKLEKLRELYFERVENNTIDFERFVEYFKWIDNSLSSMLVQLFPASADFSENLRTLIESHVLERNKYQSKFPTLEARPATEGAAYGVNELLYPWARGHAPIPNSNTAANCFWWKKRVSGSNPHISSGDDYIDFQRNVYRELGNGIPSPESLKPGYLPLLSATFSPETPLSYYYGQQFGRLNFGIPYRLCTTIAKEIKGGSNFPKGKILDFAHEQIKETTFGTSNIILEVTESSINQEVSCSEEGCEDIVLPITKERLEGAFVDTSNSPSDSLSSYDYNGGTIAMFAPFSLFSSSMSSSRLGNFRANTHLTNYHDDSYGKDHEVPVQGPFTNAHVGGRQYRHIGLNTPSSPLDTTATRPEAWDLNISVESLQITSRKNNPALPRATMFRDETAKRPVNIKNIEWGTASAVVGNYQKCYEILQTAGRTSNNRFFVKNEGFTSSLAASTYVTGIVDFALPRYDLTGSTTCIFVNRFSAPGGPEVNSRGSLDIYAEEFSPYNELNNRNLTVRKALNTWSKNHSGQFGILSVSGTIEGYQQTRWQDYNTLANYHKVNRNAGLSDKIKNGYDQEIEWVNLINITLSNYNRTLTKPMVFNYWDAAALSHQKLPKNGYIKIEAVSTDGWAFFGLSATSKHALGTTVEASADMKYAIYLRDAVAPASNPIYVYENGSSKYFEDTAYAAGDQFRIVRDKNVVYYQYLLGSSTEWQTFYTSEQSGEGDLYPSIALYGVSTGVGGFEIANARISNPLYDNWFVQHPIPQSALQYAWINASYDKSADQPFGYVSNYSIPSASTSTTQSAILFTTASAWVYPGLASGEGHLINYSNVLSLAPSTLALDPSAYKYSIDEVTIDWFDFVNITASDNNRTLTKRTGGSIWADVSSHTKLIGDGYLEFELPELVACVVGLSSEPGGGGYGSAPLMQYAFYTYAHGIFQIKEEASSKLVYGDHMYSPGDKFRIHKQGSQVFYQISEGGGTQEFRTLYSSERSAIGSFSPDAAIWGSGLLKIKNIKVVSDRNTLWPGYGYVSGNANLPAYINAHFNNINGPYPSPSWKTLRSGEHPVNRYNKNKNILSIDGAGGLFSKDRFNWGGIAYLKGLTPFKSKTNFNKDTRIQSLHLVEPPVTFKYKPLKTSLIDPTSLAGPLSIKSVYANNLGSFANNQFVDFLGITNNSRQMYDNIRLMYDVDKTVTLNNFKYNEVVYPREVNTGLKKIRGRTKYAETAITAVINDGINGIDRGPLKRRTFWRDSATDRNRRGFAFLNSDTSPMISGNLPNSQGYYDSFATSINGWGATPIVFEDGGTARTDYLSGANLSLFPDCGELNSANYQTIGGYIGANPASFGTLASGSTWYPTASCYYYHRQTIFNPGEIGTGSFGILKWRTSELSGKYPWFDSYEDYEEDIRGIGKSFTILPEFRISEHMDYYIDGNFKNKNDKFLSLDGAEITSSARQASQPLGRGFNEEFFAEYSNSDFQKYFGRFETDEPVSRITLKCNAIKKLLPYHGFYPSHRTLQLASMFSQSIAPYIGGLNWQTGSQTPGQQGNWSGIAVQSLLQPYFAPGIMYNTIKSGLAVDWQCFTGSVSSSFTTHVGNVYLNSTGNYRIPFESILDPLGAVGLPNSSSNGEGKINLLYPTYRSLSSPGPWSYEYRLPHVDIELGERTKAYSSNKYTSYRLAINNFMAEVPNFFLQDRRLKSIMSIRQGDVSMVDGTTYSMNIYIEKSNDFVMIQDYWNGFRGEPEGNRAPRSEPITPGTTARSWNGRYFGPPTRAGSPSKDPLQWGPSQTTMGDPAYAPYTPPYFYGKSIAKVSYLADDEDEKGNFSYQKLFEKATVTQQNPQLEYMMNQIDSGSFSPAASGSMPVSASLSLFGIFAEKESRLDANGNLIEVVDSPNSDRNRWVVSTRMETPVLNFNSQPEQKGYGRGMWSGYGELLTSESGITFGVEESSTSQNAPSLLQKCFIQPQDKSIGEIADQKEISEAIIAIPFAIEDIQPGDVFAETTEIMGKNFFRIEQSVFDYYRRWYLENKLANITTSPDTPSESMTRMLALMGKYILPPELDFLTFAAGSKKVNPFAMYIFEFNHKLQSQDLADIWQGVMPDISRIAELSSPDKDHNIFSHPTGISEFFHGKRLPNQMRWMVFKVKKRANFDYFKLTADTTDDAKFGFKFNVGGVELPYSYNWPYDYFSLVELAEMEVETEFAPPAPTPTVEQPGTTSGSPLSLITIPETGEGE